MRRTIIRWIDNFNYEGNIKNKNGRRKPSVTQKTINKVRFYFKQNLKRSIRRAKRDPSISFSTVCKILKILIQMFPYKITKVQHLSDNDKLKSVVFAQ